MKNLYIVNCGEFEALLSSIQTFCKYNKYRVKKILDYDEYKDSIIKYFDVEFHSFYDNIRTKDESSNRSEYEYLDKKTLEFANKHFATALEILLVRHNSYGVNFSYAEAKDLYFTSLNRAIGELRLNHINLIIFNHIPHHFNTYILYLASKFLKIQTLFFTILCFNGFRYFFDKEIGVRGFSVKMKIPSGNSVDKLDFIEYEKIKNRSKYETPIYIGNFFNRSYTNLFIKIFGSNLYSLSLISIIGAWKNGFFSIKKNHHKISCNKSFNNEKFPNNLALMVKQIKEKYLNKKIANTYHNFSSPKEKIASCYVIFAPNYQPEATTLPSAGDYSNILLCIRLLRASLPEDIQIVYKEHEDIFNLNLEGFRCRDYDFYSNVAAINNLIIIERSANQIELIDNSLCIVIQTSNIGLEAGIRGKKVIAFGPSWFDELGFVTKWNDFIKSKNFYQFLGKKHFFNRSLLLEINKYTLRIPKSYNANDGLKEKLTKLIENCLI